MAVVIRSLFDRILAKSVLVETGCMLFQGACTPDGYGNVRVKIDGKWYVRRVHRLMYEECVGPIPVGLVLRHKCDTPPCWRPDHMIPGTYKENVVDMIIRRRGANQYGNYTSWQDATAELPLEVLENDCPF